MASIFDHLDDFSSDDDQLYNFTALESDSSDESNLDSEDEDPLGPDLHDPDDLSSNDEEDNYPPGVVVHWGSLSLRPTPEPPILPTSLPIRQPEPIRANQPEPILPIRQPEPIRPQASNHLTVQSLEAMAGPSIPHSTARLVPKQGKQQHSVGARIMAIALHDAGISYETIEAKTHVKKRTVYNLVDKARDRGWRPGQIVQVEHVDDKVRKGRPGLTESTKDKIIAIVTKNSTTRGWSCARIAQELAKDTALGPHYPSPSSVYRTLKERGYNVYRRTIKPGLNTAQKKARLEWCKKYAHWTLEDWKNVIFTDETSVQKGGVRGKRRVWRLKTETHNPHCITRRWKGFSEFMWWTSFSYDKKGPYHIWEVETKEEKAARILDIETRNKGRYESDKRRWEEDYRSKNRRTRASQKKPLPQFKHTEKWGLIVCKKGRGGINWYRYQEKILRPKLLPFAKECIEAGRPKTVVQVRLLL